MPVTLDDGPDSARGPIDHSHGGVAVEHARNASPQIVIQPLTMELISANGVLPVAAELEYDPSSPYAATARFIVDEATVSWTFARDLLCQGIYEPAGRGEVRVRPDLDDEGHAAVLIELHSPQGVALLLAPSRDVARFLDRSTSVVRPGTESGYLDIDATIDAVLVGAAGD
jgi:hypothetical protein